MKAIILLSLFLFSTELMATQTDVLSFDGTTVPDGLHGLISGRPISKFPPLRIARYSIGHEKEATFIRQILDPEKIEYHVAGNHDSYVFVGQQKTDKARYVLAKALIKRPMNILLYGKRDSKLVISVISPQEVIKQYEALKAERQSRQRELVP